MAGSWGHVTNDDGTLRDWAEINESLECQSGDVVECVTELYGMIWWLAQHRARMRFATTDVTREQILDVIASARENYRDGLALGKGHG